MTADTRVLQPEFIPREVQHGDAEVNYLSASSTRSLRGNELTPALIHGPSGAGKTCIVQLLVEPSREEVVNLNYQYVNCRGDHSRFKTLYGSTVQTRDLFRSFREIALIVGVHDVEQAIEA